MSFPTMDSLKARAKQRGFRQPNEGESDDQYRNAFADFMLEVDRIEAAEIRAGLPWDQQSPQMLLGGAGYNVGKIIRDYGPVGKNAGKFEAEAYRIAEEAHKGVQDQDLHAMCRTACIGTGWEPEALYSRSKVIYDRDFAD